MASATVAKVPVAGEGLTEPNSASRTLVDADQRDSEGVPSSSVTNSMYHPDGSRPALLGS